jgi:translation initiation factor 3 subunit B
MYCKSRYIFVEFSNPDDASFAMHAMNKFPFDTKHTFQINKFTDIESYAEMDETYVEPEVEEYQDRVGIHSATVCHSVC